MLRGGGNFPSPLVGKGVADGCNSSERRQYLLAGEGHVKSGLERVVVAEAVLSVSMRNAAGSGYADARYLNSSRSAVA
jgi:hypothetical protein